MNPLILLAFISTVWAAPMPKKIEARLEVRPQVKHATLVGNVTNPKVSRDSCGSARADDRVFWTCRDTSPWDASAGQVVLPVIPTTASWSDVDANGPVMVHGIHVGPGSSGANKIHRMYGHNTASHVPYFPVPDDECPSNGMCPDSTRYVNWPDSPPAITSSSGSGWVGYTWAPRSHLQGLTELNPAPAHTLYKSSYTASLDRKAMPSVSVVDLDFWKEGEIGYGRYGNLIKDGVLYLYGKQTNGGIALAKVSTDSVENRSAYEFYVNGQWTSQMPSMDDTSAAIQNAGAGGQGTFYYSSHYNSIIWIGQASIAATADFYMTTAPSPEGPWLQPYQIYQGENGDSGIGGYSLQAHPALLPSTDASENAIYLTWTQQWLAETYAGVYVTPLLYVEFE